MPTTIFLNGSVGVTIDASRDDVIKLLEEAMTRREDRTVGNPAVLTLHGAAIRSAVVDGVPVMNASPTGQPAGNTFTWAFAFRGGQLGDAGKAAKDKGLDANVPLNTVRQASFVVGESADVRLLVRGPANVQIGQL
jgi:hypothetical protein